MILNDATITVPDTPEGLAELLADDAKRQAVFATKDTTQEFFAKYTKTMNNGGAISKQISEQVTNTMTEFLKENGVTKPDQTALAELKANMRTSTPPGFGNGAIRNAAHNPKLLTAKLDGLYNGLGEFVMDIQSHRQGRAVRNPEAFAEVQEITNKYSELDPATGGFLVPEEMRSTILSLSLEQSIVRSRATVITMGSLSTKIPFVDATTHVGSVFGGMVFYWVGESETITPTEAKFGNVKLEANKLVGGARVPNELWRDAPALSSWLEMAAPMGLSFYEDVGFITGNGVDQPLGVLESPAKIEVAKESAQSADTIVTENVLKMYSRMLPQSLGNAVWLVNQTTLPQLFTLNIGTNENPIFIVDITASPRMTMLGRPIIVTEKVPALGNAGDIAFIDWRYYLLGDRQAVSMDFSEHSRFMNDETEMRIIERVDGRPWVQSALTPLNGETVSPYVTLAERA